jgi:hypothetical protein
MAIFRGTGSAATSSDQTTIDTVTQAVVDAEAARDLAEDYKDDAQTAKNAAEALYGDLTAVNTAKTAAETAASTATTKASEASASATSAAEDATAANESFILTRGAFLDFQTLYLGVLASDPETDNEGNPLEEGALYFNSTDDVMRTYDGSEWFTAFASLGGAMVGTNNLSDVSSAATALTNLGLNATASEINVLDVSAQTPTDGQVLTYDTTNGLNWETPASGISNVVEDTTPQLGGDLDANGKKIDMGVNDITDTKVGQWDTAYGWGNHGSVGYLTSLAINGVSDITITTPADNEVLAYNSATSTWINQTPSEAGLATTSDITNMLVSSDIGTSVQAYDADTAKTDTAQTFTASQRGTVTTDDDMSFDMSATNNFSATPTGTPTLTFTNITAGQSGNIYVDNSAGATISAAATTFINASDLTTLSTAGKYWLSYYSPDGTNVYVSTTPATTSQGV